MANLQDANNFFVYGEPLVDGGICNIKAQEGVGLVTRGLVWVFASIWDYPQALSGISTSWAAYAAGNSLVPTVWSPYSAGQSLVPTVWTDPVGGIWGEASSRST